jgi:hypothetical protein
MVVVTAKDQVSEQSLKEPQKWNVKMKLKMTEGRVPFLKNENKNEIENELEMA